MRCGEILVSCEVTGSVQNYRSNDIAGLSRFLVLVVLSALPDGKHATFYGITRLYRKDPKPFHKDLPELFELLAEGKTQPVIAGVYPLTQAAQANEMLEAGDQTIARLHQRLRRDATRHLSSPGDRLDWRRTGNDRHKTKEEGALLDNSTR